MTAEQSMAQAIKQAEIQAIKAAVMAVREADNLIKNARSMNITPRLGATMLRQSIFDGEV